MHFIYKTTLLLILASAFVMSTLAQSLEPKAIKALISNYKADARGPYKDIRWFCKDGSVRDPKDTCPAEIAPGMQHARYKESVEALALSNHIFLGQILAYTDPIKFWDAANNFSRLKQYQLEKYLRTVDEGWILRKGQYYRGALQVEDEEAWGLAFYTSLLTKDENLKKYFFLIRQSLKDVPHKGDDNVAQLMRSQSKVISDELTSFMNIRVKIHGQPEVQDIEKVKTFMSKSKGQLTADLSDKFTELLVTMEKFYSPFDFLVIQKKVTQFQSPALIKAFDTYLRRVNGSSSPQAIVEGTAQVLLSIRQEILQEKKALNRLELLDISLQLEALVFKNAPKWEVETLEHLFNKLFALAMANAGAGYIELWEWEEIVKTLEVPDKSNVSLGNLMGVLEALRGEVEWSAAMVKTTYQPIVNTFTTFEPLAYGFIDDRIRGAITLPLGQAVAQLGELIAKESSLTNKVFDLRDQASFRGLNPGYALGELVVIDGSPDEVEVNSNKIYIFERAPADLKPVAGIVTVSEGNLVSHVQLLARNLGIPNAALSDQQLLDLRVFSGKRVFYAVSNKGNVILKLEKDMNNEERLLFDKKARAEEKIAVPVEKILLDQNSIINLRDVNADDSGKLCGPKAANLGQLKQMFPDMVVEGLVIPFGIFREHMDQPMPSQSGSYWNFLNALFNVAQEMTAAGSAAEVVEQYQLEQLKMLRKAILAMPLKANFIATLEQQFATVLGQQLGQVPVFLRSDTNMEDLKDFTGAGLNLTVFNVVARDKILNGIKEVWASPYTERSFKWRQKYLLNPENVFPSILVIPSVDVDYSGVLITKGISNGMDKDLTIAFNRGAGGAVDGQAAETYLLSAAGDNILLAPLRETYANTLPSTGGTAKKAWSFEKGVLSAQNLQTIRNIAQEIRMTMPDHDTYEGAYDVELGFKNDTLWLFQIRPFVENKRAVGSSYLESITPKVDKSKLISMSKKL
jgi:hypothetical protein